MKIIILFYCILLGTACTVNETESNDLQDLRGKWREIEPESIGQFAGSNHLFQFKPDSFFVTIGQFTDAAAPTDPCSQFHWTEYAAGIYRVTSDIIAFDGVYSDSLFSEISSGCWNVGKYDFTYPFTLRSDTLLLNPQLELFHQIKLVKERG